MLYTCFGTLWKVEVAVQDGRAVLSTGAALNRLPFWPIFVNWWRAGQEHAQETLQEDPVYSANA